MGTSSGGGMKSDINVTPLVDVVLVLLIIFMVVTPELQRGKEVALPKADAAKRREDGGDPLVVSIEKSGKVYIEQDPVSKDALADAIKNAPGRAVLIKGDSGLRYGDVKGIIATIRNAGAAGVSLAAEAPEGGAKP
ncbi:MAG: biopolymer transporter ExbD [Deltaproteobacteria bacterium]|nr:biopolymer transporter ExbD [Deltaproteobacteria bacterium]